jgi:epoxyqueuosine reductase
MSALEERADALGVELGVAPVEPGPELFDLEAFVADGRHGSMGWLARARRRADPRRLMASAQSVLSIAMPYPAPPPPPPADRPRGFVAAYALGEDYHRVTMKAVRALKGVLRRPADRAYVDAHPMMEKPLAQRAGLGWQGKHTNLVSRRLGSWFFLGELLTSHELPISRPETDHCGSCTRCLDVCPTGAISRNEPYRIDARRCISYLTIELRGPIPRSLRPAVGGWIYGCDLCLAVCPFNKFAKEASEVRFEAREWLVNPVLTDLLAWDETIWATRLHHSAMLRASRAMLLRNVAVALGNAGDIAAVPALTRCLVTEPEPLIRGHAAWALGRLGGASSRAALERGRADPDPFVREEVEAALAAF